MFSSALIWVQLELEHVWQHEFKSQSNLPENASSNHCSVLPSGLGMEMSDSMPRACDTHIGAEEYLSPQWPSWVFSFFRACTSLPHYGFGFYLFRQISSYPETFLASVNRVGALNRYTIHN